MSVKITSGTYTTINDTAENTVLTSTVRRPRWVSCFFDLTNITAATLTIRTKVRVDGTNYRTLDTNDGRYPYVFTTASDDDGPMIGPILTDEAVQITFQLATGQAVSVPYRLMEYAV